MARAVVVAGAMTDFGPQPDVEVHELARRAAHEAVTNAGIPWESVEIAFAGHAYQGACFGQKTLMKVGVTGIPIINVENACASGATAVMLAAQAIDAGRAEVALAIGAEKLTAPGGGFLPIVADDLDSSMGRVMPAAFAMMARMHMDRYGTTPMQMAKIAVKNRANAALNPRIPSVKQVSAEEVLASPVIADPLTRLSCCPNSDGAAATVLMSEAAARRFGLKSVKIVASILNSGLRTPYGIVDDKSEMSIRAAKAAYAQAGFGPEDLDVVEMHDPFTIAELVHYEDLGLCAPGEGGRYIDDGSSAIGGKVAVSPSGGLLGRGHPLGATGVAQIVELFWQLTGKAGRYQVEGARVGLAHTVGGGVTKIESGACAVHILTV